jgi:hypothetical protein
LIEALSINQLFTSSIPELKIGIIMLNYIYHKAISLKSKLTLGISVFLFTFGSLPLSAAAQTNDKISMIQDIVIEEANEYGVDPALALAIAKVESNFDPRARSHAGARGVMQIMPKTAQQVFGVSPRLLYNARVNIRLGVRFIKQLLDKYDQDIDIALSHYNGGSAVKDKMGRLRVIPATSQYVDKVQAARLRFQQSSGKVFEAKLFAQNSPYRYSKPSLNQLLASNVPTSQSIENNAFSSVFRSQQEQSNLERDTFPINLAQADYHSDQSDTLNANEKGPSAIVKVTPALKIYEFNGAEQQQVSNNVVIAKSKPMLAGVKIKGPSKKKTTYAEKITKLQEIRVHNIMRNSNKTSQNVAWNKVPNIAATQVVDATATANFIVKDVKPSSKRVRYTASQGSSTNAGHFVSNKGNQQAIKPLDHLSDKRKKVLAWETIYH